MKIFATIGMMMIVPLSASGQDQPSGKTLASTIDVYVFPREAQDAAQQSTDEVECYDWAADSSGGDPFDLATKAESDEAQAEQEMAAADDVGRGSGVRGAARGAAAGAVIGEIADDDAGKGAAYGAAAGAVVSRRRGRMAQADAEQQAAQQADSRQAATAEDLDNFKKAFSVCLEAKDYMVKY